MMIKGKKMHRCSLCGGDVLQQVDDIVLKFPRLNVVIEQAEVGECRDCGQRYHPATTSQRIVSGHILGIAFLISHQGENYLRIPIPPILDIRIRGDRVVAGLACFAVSLLAVGLFWTETAKNIFIIRMEATDNTFTACQSFATLLSVVICLCLGGVVWLTKQLKSGVSRIGHEEEGVRRFIRDEEDRNEKDK